MATEKEQKEVAERIHARWRIDGKTFRPKKYNMLYIMSLQEFLENFKEYPVEVLCMSLMEIAAERETIRSGR